MDKLLKWNIRKRLSLMMVTLFTLSILSSLVFTVPMAGASSEWESKYAKKEVKNPQECISCQNENIEPSLQREISPAIISQLEFSLKDHLKRDAELKHYKIIAQTIKPVSQKLYNRKAEVIFLVEKTYLLDYPKPEDVPILKAQISYLTENKERLSSKALAAAKKQIEELKGELQEQISTPQSYTDSLKVTLEVDEHEIAIPGSAVVYGELPSGEWKPLKDFNYIPSDQEIEKGAAEGLQQTIALAEASDKVEILYTYDRIKARDYALQYTSNPTFNNCTGCNSNSTNCDQDKTKYNNQYQCWCCGDCANYVSQAQKDGGMTTTSTWQPYTHAWIRVFEQEQYMKNTTGRWVSTNYQNCVAGYPIVVPSGDGHLVMVTLNNGSEIRFSAHTNDKKDRPWYWPSGARYYMIVNV